jgi:hypothetical protein
MKFMEFLLSFNGKMIAKLIGRGFSNKSKNVIGSLNLQLQGVALDPLHLLGYPCLACISPPPYCPHPRTTFFKFKRFCAYAFFLFLDKKFPVAAVPSLATSHL